MAMVAERKVRITSNKFAAARVFWRARQTRAAETHFLWLEL